MKSILASILLSIVTIAGSDAVAQATGEVNFKTLGIRFTIPNGWVGQEVNGGYIVGSNTQAGFAFLTIHQYTTLAQLTQEAWKGIAEQNGTSLKLSGEIENLNERSIGAEYSGTLEGQAVKAYIVGLVNPLGSGVTIMAASTPDQYSATHQQLAQQLANSTQFSQPQTPPVVEEWKQTLQNSRLTYMDSYQSNSGSYGGYSTGGGYSSEVQIHLCGQGFFKYKSSSSMSVDTGGAFGSSSDSGQGNGTWDVVGNTQDGATLRLNFHNGEVYEYNLEYKDNKTFLNGSRYFRTYGTAGVDDGPECF
ncbi:MAG: hypothetical protein AAF992_21810 [Bacteroidota bacterium]